LCIELNVTPAHWLQTVYGLLEKKILDGTLSNNQKDVHKYVADNIKDILLEK
jgi:hypothetical protein